MKKILAFMAVAILFTSTSADAFIGQSRTYKIESDFGITGPAKLVVLPKAFHYQTKTAYFYVPFSSIDYTLLEGTTLTVSVRGRLITLKTRSKATAQALNKDLTRAISGEYQ